MILSWIEFIEYISKLHKPIMLATGASTLDDVKRAMDIIIKYNSNIVIMQCNTNYTADINNFKSINLNVLNKYNELYEGIVLGLSDHTLGHSTVLGAVTLGARVIEKHFTDDNTRKGPDHKFAMNPITWKDLVDRTRELELALGDGIKRVEDNENYALIECKLGSSGIEDGVKHLLNLESLIKEKNMRKPTFKMIITGGEMAYTRKDAVHIVPIGCLGV